MAEQKVITTLERRRSQVNTEAFVHMTNFLENGTYNNIKEVMVSSIRDPKPVQPLELFLEYLRTPASQKNLDVELTFEVSDTSSTLITKGNYKRGGVPFANACFLTMSLFELLTKVNTLKQLIENEEYDEIQQTNQPEFLVLGWCFKELGTFASRTYEVIEQHAREGRELLEFVQTLDQDYQNLRVVHVMSVIIRQSIFVLNWSQDQGTRNEIIVNWKKCLRQKLASGSNFSLLQLCNILFHLVNLFYECLELYENKNTLENQEMVKSYLDSFPEKVKDCSRLERRILKIVENFPMSTTGSMTVSEVKQTLETALKAERSTSKMRVRFASETPPLHRYPPEDEDVSAEEKTEPVVVPVAVSVGATEEKTAEEETEAEEEEVDSEATEEDVPVSPTPIRPASASAETPELPAVPAAPSFLSRAVSKGLGTIRRFLKPTAAEQLPGLKTQIQQRLTELSQIRVNVNTVSTRMQQNIAGAKAVVPELVKEALQGQVTNGDYMAVQSQAATIFGFVTRANKLLVELRPKLGKFKDLLAQLVGQTVELEQPGPPGQVPQPDLAQLEAEKVFLQNTLQALSELEGELKNLYEPLDAPKQLELQVLDGVLNKKSTDLRRVVAALVTLQKQKLPESEENRVPEPPLTVVEAEGVLEKLNKLSTKSQNLAAFIRVNAERYESIVKSLNITQAPDYRGALENYMAQANEAVSTVKSTFLKAQRYVEGEKAKVVKLYLSVLEKQAKQFQVMRQLIQECKALLTRLETTKVGKYKKYIIQQVRNKVKKWVEEFEPEIQRTFEEVEGFIKQLYGADSAEHQTESAFLKERVTGLQETSNYFKSLEEKLTEERALLTPSSPLLPETEPEHPPLRIANNKFQFELNRYKTMSTSRLSDLKTQVNNLINSEVLRNKEQLESDVNQVVNSCETLRSEAGTAYSRVLRYGALLNMETEFEVLNQTKMLPLAEFEKEINKLVSQIRYFEKEHSNKLKLDAKAEKEMVVKLNRAINTVQGLLRKITTLSEKIVKAPNASQTRQLHQLFERVSTLVNELSVDNVRTSLQVELLHEALLEKFDEVKRVYDATRVHLDRLEAQQSGLQVPGFADNDTEPEIPYAEVVEEDDLTKPDRPLGRVPEYAFHRQQITSLIAPTTNQVVRALKFGVKTQYAKQCAATAAREGGGETIYFPTMFRAGEESKCERLQDVLGQATSISEKTNGEIRSFMLVSTYLKTIKFVTARGIFGQLKDLLRSVVVSLSGETLSSTYNLFDMLDNSLILNMNDEFNQISLTFIANSHVFEPVTEREARNQVIRLPMEVTLDAYLTSISNTLMRNLVVIQLKYNALSVNQPYEVNEWGVIRPGPLSNKAPYYVLFTEYVTNVGTQRHFAALVPLVPGTSRGGK